MEYRVIKCGIGFPKPVTRGRGMPHLSRCQIGSKWDPGEMKERNKWNPGARLDNYLNEITFYQEKVDLHESEDKNNGPHVLRMQRSFERDKTQVTLCKTRKIFDPPKGTKVTHARYKTTLKVLH